MGTLSEKVCSIPLPLSDRDDVVCWGLNANDKLSVKSATWVQNAIVNDNAKTEMLKKMWKLNIPNKVKLFSWLLILNKLQTPNRIHKFINTINDICPLCNTNSEGKKHLFIHCVCAKQVWDRFSFNREPSFY